MSRSSRRGRGRITIIELVIIAGRATRPLVIRLIHCRRCFNLSKVSREWGEGLLLLLLSSSFSSSSPCMGEGNRAILKRSILEASENRFWIRSKGIKMKSSTDLKPFDSAADDVSVPLERDNFRALLSRLFACRENRRRQKTCARAAHQVTIKVNAHNCIITLPLASAARDVFACLNISRLVYSSRYEGCRAAVFVARRLPDDSFNFKKNKANAKKASAPRFCELLLHLRPSSRSYIPPAITVQIDINIDNLGLTLGRF